MDEARKISPVAAGNRGKGRPKGAVNKFTRTLKDAILAAADNQEGGAEGYLTRQAVENPVAFMTLIGRVLPYQIAGEDGGPIQIAMIRRVIHDPAAE